MNGAIQVRVTRSTLTIQNCPEALAGALTYTHYKIGWDNGNFQTTPMTVAWANYDVRSRLVQTYPNALHLILEKARRLNLELTVEDQRILPRLSIAALKPGEYQPVYPALQAVARAHSSGLIVSLSSPDKTLIICGLVKMLPCHFKVLVTTEARNVVNQIHAQLNKALPDEAIGILNKPRFEPGRVIVANLDALSAFSQGEMAYSGCALRDFDAWICDEVHRLPVESRRPFINQFRTVFSWGLTATPQRNDNAHLLNQVYFGPTLFGLTPGEVQEIQRQTADVRPVRVHVFPLYTAEPIPEEASSYRKNKLAYLKNPKLALLLRGMDEIIPADKKVLVFVNTLRLGLIVNKALPHFALVHGKRECRRQLMEEFRMGAITRLIVTEVWTDAMSDRQFVIDCSTNLSPIVQLVDRTNSGAESKEPVQYIMLLCTTSECLFNQGLAKLQAIEQHGWEVSFMFDRSYLAQIPYPKAPLLAELGHFAEETKTP